MNFLNGKRVLALVTATALLGLVALQAPAVAVEPKQLQPKSLAPVAKAPVKKLLFALNFNETAGTKPNRKYLAFEEGSGDRFGNGELQCYTSSTANAASNGSGSLVIHAEKVTDATDPDYAIRDYCGSYTSARLSSQGKVSFMYGRLEARIKMSSGIGTWPAFWMLGTNINPLGWPDCGEIDVVENKGLQPKAAYATAHGPGYAGQGIGDIMALGRPLSEDYHTYAIEWKKNSIRWYLDGLLMHAISPRDTAPNPYVFNHRFFMILNLAMGGSFTGDIDPNLQSADLSFDWIRFYSINGVGKVYRK